jgi:hypothetical protein
VYNINRKIKRGNPQMKKFFSIGRKYQFEWNYLRCILMVINAICIIHFKLSIAWLGLGIATFGLVKDFFVDRRINGFVLHLSSAIIYIYLLLTK